jgi:hypothetical protein
MKKLLILLVASAILGGCSELPDDNITVNNSRVNTPTQAVPTQTNNGSSNTNEQPSNSGLVDQVAFDGAVRLKDLSYCEKIVNVDLKQQCIDTVNQDVPVTPAEVDCTKLTVIEEKEACLLAKQIEEQAKQQQLEQEKAIADGVVKRDQAVLAGDLSSCKDLTVFGQKVGCEANILTNKAIQQNDKTICSQASMPEAKEACEMDFNKSAAITAPSN